MKTTLLAPLLAAALLAGCATPTQLRQRPPDLELSSAKDATTVASCIVDKWGNYSGGKIIPVDMRPAAKGFAMTTDGFGSLAPLIDVQAMESGSTTQLYQLLPVSDSFKAMLKGCQ